MKIAIIDFDSIVHSSFYGNKVNDKETGEPMKVDGKFVIVPKTDQEIKDTVDGIMYHIFREGNFTHYIAYVKGIDTIKDRLAINPSYKQQRTKETPEKWDFTKDYSIGKWGVIEVNGIEVDDAVRITKVNLANSHVVSIDKDVLWLEGDNFNWRKNEWSTVNAEDEERYLSRSLIIGDTVDNLKGLPGRGEKFCDKHNINTVHQAFNAYIFELGLQKGVEEFYKSFKCLYILRESEKFTKIPNPIEVPKNINNESEINRSRSTTGEFHSS